MASPMENWRGRSLCRYLTVLGLTISTGGRCARGDDDDLPSTTHASPAESRYGLFGLLDRRSRYGTEFFPEPFRVDDSDVGNEIRFDWEHDETRHGVSNALQLQVEKSFGLVTFEIQAPYVIDAAASVGGDGDDAAAGGTGFGNISLSARVPVWQYVSPAEFFDNTVGAEFELGIPTNSPAGKNTEAAPALFDDLRLGAHFSVQSLFSLSWTFGSKPQGGARQFDYGASRSGYTIEDEEFKVPGVERLHAQLRIARRYPPRWTIRRP